MNPGTPTSPVQGEVLSYAIRRRSEGAYWDVIAAELRTMTGKNITGPMVGAVVRRKGKPSVSKGQAPSADSTRAANYTHVVHTESKTHGGNVLVISDPQEPYALEDVVAFLRRQRAEFNISRENAVHVGDEADFLYGSRFPVDPDNEDSAVGELKWLRDRMKVWYAEFPKLRVCVSNHTDRWYKKAAGAQIPSQLVRARNEILEAPQEWVWADHWDFLDGKMPWRCEHGHNGAQNTRIRAIENGISTAHGHWHSKAGAEWAHTAGGQLVWGLATGCLIDAEAVAFKYTKRDRFKPIIGCGVVLDGGRKPLFVPYDG